MATEERDIRYTVPVTAELDEQVKKRLETGGFSSMAEYLRGLMRQDLKENRKVRLEELLLEGVGDESYAEVTADLFAELRERVQKARDKS